MLEAADGALGAGRLGDAGRVEAVTAGRGEEKLLLLSQALEADHARLCF